MRDLRRREIVMSLLSFFFGSLSGAKAAEPKFRDIRELRNYAVAFLVKQRGVSKIRLHPQFEEIVLYYLNNNKVESNLTNLFGYISINPDENVDKIIANWFESVREKNQDRPELNIIPTLRERSYIAEISNLRQGVLVDDFLNDVKIIYMVDRPKSISPVVLDELPGKTAADVRREAYDNARGWLNRIVSDDISGLGMLYYVEGNTMLSPSLILLSEFWDSIKFRFPKDALIAIPRRDQLFIFDDTAEGRSVARKMIKVTIDEGYGVLSSTLYARRGGKFMALRT